MDETQLHKLHGYFLAFDHINSFHDWKCHCNVSPLPPSLRLAASLAESLERWTKNDQETSASAKWGRIPIAYEPAEVPLSDDRFDALLGSYLAPDWLTEDAWREAAGLPPTGHIDAETVGDFMTLSEDSWVPTARSLLAKTLGGEPIVPAKLPSSTPHTRKRGSREQDLHCNRRSGRSIETFVLLLGLAAWGNDRKRFPTHVLLPARK